MRLPVLPDFCTIPTPILKVGVMRKPFATLRMLAVLAIGLAVFSVVQDARQRAPFWSTGKSASRRYAQRVESATDEYRMLDELRAIPVGNDQGARSLVKLLAHPNTEVRRLAMQVVHEHLDVWRLSIEDSGGTRIENLMRLLNNETSANPAGYRFAGRNLVERVQRLHQHAGSASGKKCLELCENIARLIGSTELRTANRNDGFGAEDTEAFEDHFALPGGGL